MTVASKPADKDTKGPTPMPSPQGKLRPAGMVFVDEAGNRFWLPAKIDRVKRGGRPKKTLRDVALTLHFDFLCTVLVSRKKAAYAELTAMFGIRGDPQKEIRKIIKRMRADVLRRFPHFVACNGLLPDNRLLPSNRVMAYLVRHDDGTVEGYAVTWGGLNAGYGRGTMTINPGGEDGFDLELDPDHPGLKRSE